MFPQAYGGKRGVEGRNGVNSFLGRLKPTIVRIAQPMMADMSDAEAQKDGQKQSQSNGPQLLCCCNDAQR